MFALHNEHGGELHRKHTGPYVAWHNMKSHRSIFAGKRMAEEQCRATDRLFHNTVKSHFQVLYHTVCANSILQQSNHWTFYGLLETVPLILRI